MSLSGGVLGQRAFCPSTGRHGLRVDGAISVQRLSANCTSIYPSLLSVLLMVGVSVISWEPSVIDPVPRGAMLLPKNAGGTQRTTLLSMLMTHADCKQRQSERLASANAGASLAVHTQQGLSFALAPSLQTPSGLHLRQMAFTSLIANVTHRLRARPFHFTGNPRQSLANARVCNSCKD